MNHDRSFGKLIGALLLGILGVWFIYAILTGIGTGVSGYHGGGYGHMGYGGASAGMIGTTSLILLVLIKILFVLFIIGLVVGIVLAIKNYIFTDDDVRKMKSTFVGSKVTAMNTCATCGKELDNQWKVCPYCGNEIENKVV